MPLRASRTFQVDPALPRELEPLRRLAYNLRWTWDAATVELFMRFGQREWEESGHNPVALLQSTPQGKLVELASDDGFIHQMNAAVESLSAYLSRSPRLPLPLEEPRQVAAYFSLEFALAECLPNYSGGLGVLAGDHLKSASDLGLPLVGVGLLYAQGYFQQELRPDGWQEEVYAPNDPSRQPVSPVVNDAGERLTVSVPIEGREVFARLWSIEVGSVRLFLLDTAVEANAPEDRDICSALYGGDARLRLKQEIVLGIGGVRALKALDLSPVVCHMNEGHSALLGLERIRQLMEETGRSFDEARIPVAASGAFTTHTAVAAGIDLFPPELVVEILGPYYRSFGLTDGDVLGLGRVHPADAEEPFSMALLGFRLSDFRNGVSKLHRGVSQDLWKDVWPSIPAEEAPISSVTNGVHLPTWVGAPLANLYDRYLGPEWRDNPIRPGLWEAIAEIPDSELFAAHEQARERLIARARRAHREGALRRGDDARLLASGEILEPRTLTIGFARRFAAYKRGTLLFRNPERLARIINNPERPVQFIFAGKSHPRDEAGKQLIREVVYFSQRPEFRQRVVFLEQYDLSLARDLVQGADVWLNTPLRPLEASGTSGMKACANGALHASIRDGWWHEAHLPGAGWAIGRDNVDDSPEVQDAFDAEAIYDLIEYEIAPLFYERAGDGVPGGWVQAMKRSIAAYAPGFNTSRMVEDYATQAYLPAIEAWSHFTRDGMAAAADLASWLTMLRASWNDVRISAIRDNTAPDAAAQPGSELVEVEADISLGNLSPADVAVHAIVGIASPGGELQSPVAIPLTPATEHEGAATFHGSFVPHRSGRVGYVIRVLPNHPNLHDPLSLDLVAWS